MREILCKGIILQLVCFTLPLWGDFRQLEQDFQRPSPLTRQACGPLFWLHGDESKDRLETYIEKIAESGCGTFTAESRPHKDWLGPDWYRDLSICLNKAKAQGLTMWIFDDYWWPSQMMGGRVPEKYGAKRLTVRTVRAKNGEICTIKREEHPSRFIGAVAGKEISGGIEADSLIDLTAHINGDTLTWTPPAGNWKVLLFSWEHLGKLGVQRKYISVDGADRNCVEWFLKEVYQPHYDHFGKEFGKTIQGFFYDEPETAGDWGPEVMAVLKERGVDWKRALVSWKATLAGEAQISARYQYADALAEAWGRTLYGGMKKWCKERGVLSIGHMMEQFNHLFSQNLCAGNYMSLMKYSDMGGIDLVCRQFLPGQRINGLWQMAKLASSTAHCYGMKDDRAMCEIFGGYGQALTYPEMKGLIDQMQSRGISYMVPHSFNPHAPYDNDYPPYFYNGGKEPRFPLFKVLADYSCRLSLLLQGGHHVADVAFLFPGQSFNAGKCVKNDSLTDALDDALLDCDWMPYEVFENDTRIAPNGKLRLRDETYRILILPQAEVIPFATLEKARTFFEQGGIVAAYGMLPTRSATIGKGSADIASACETIWGKNVKPGLAPCRQNAAGGRAYFLPGRPSPEQLREAFVKNGKIVPAGDVPGGVPDGWLKILHRVKEGRDCFFISDQRAKGKARTLQYQFTAMGIPEKWNAMSGSIEQLNHTRQGNTVTANLKLEAGESICIVFRGNGNSVHRIAPPTRVQTWALKGTTTPIPVFMQKKVSFEGLSWIWKSKESALQEQPGARCFFRKAIDIDPQDPLTYASFAICGDNSFRMYVNGENVKERSDKNFFWGQAMDLDITSQLHTGRNLIAIEVVNGGNTRNPAALIGRLNLLLKHGEKKIPIDPSWKVSDREEAQWTMIGFNDKAWKNAQAVLPYGQMPWGRINFTRSAISPAKTLWFDTTVELPACTAGQRFWLEAERFTSEDAARITVNGKDAGGFIGKPYRIEITNWVKPGVNKIRFTPFVPIHPQIVLEQ